MARKSRSGAFGTPPPARGDSSKSGQPTASPARQKGIPEVVSNRMARRIAITTGFPTLLGMGVFIASYLLVSRQILDIPPGVTLLASGACFLLGLLGLSYGVLSSSWENAPGTLLGAEQIVLNLGRLRAAMGAGRPLPNAGDPSSGSPKRGA
jgi:hypothetical protein